VKEATVWFHGPHGAALVLDAVSLAAPRGQVTATVGGDGAGKTTLLRVLAGMAIVIFGAAVLRFKRSIAPARSRLHRSGRAVEGDEAVEGARP
jgi:ABC-type multidrug transport system ATPase subunit